MNCFKTCAAWRSLFLTATVILCISWAARADAESVSLTSVEDNTLYGYDPAEPSSNFNSNGSGDFFSAGRSRNRSQIRRGLIRFDFSGIPAGATVVEGSASLDFYVVDVPRRDPSPRPVWVVPLVGLGQPWDEGASEALVGVGGSGSGAAAELNDATWFHTSYDPAVHDQTTFDSNGAGFWPQQGALGNSPLDPWSLYGDPLGIVDSVIGPVSFSSAGIEADVNAWLQDGSTNFGWIVLGDETLEGDDVSSNRGYATHEHANAEFRPVLSFRYVPEPGSVWLLVSGVAVSVLWRRWR